MKNVTVKILSGLGLSLAMSGIWAATIADIKVSGIGENQRVVQIRFKDDVTMPQTSQAETPPRVVLSFPKTDLKIGQNVLQFNDPIVQRLVAVSEKDTAQLALFLNQAGQYRMEQKGDSIYLYVQSSGSDVKASAAAVSTVSVSPQRAVFTQSSAQPDADGDVANDVDVQFSKGSRNEGVVQLSLPARSSEPKIERVGSVLTLTFPNMPIAASSQKSYDVSEFGTPVRSVSVQRVGNGVKVSIHNGSGWHHSVKDQGGKYVVTVSPQVDLFSSLDERPLAKTFKGGRVTLDFQDVDVRTVLQILAKESGMNIVASDTVQGKMTLNLKDVPWDQALDLVMQARNLDMRRQGNVINIAPRSELLAQDRQVMQAQKELKEMVPLHSRTFQLRYKSVEAFKDILDSVQTANNSGESKSGTNSLFSSRGSIMIDKETNTLIVTDNQDVLNKLDKLLIQLDVPVPQVMIEARIVEVNEDFARELGVKWGGSYQRSNRYGDHSLGAPDWGKGATDSEKIPPNVSLQAAGMTSGLTYILRRGANLLGLELSAMQSEGKGKIVSSPRVLTQDRKEALLEEGADIPYQEASSSGATSTSFKKAVTGLTVTPQITPDGNVIMKLKVNKDSPNRDGSISVKRVETTAMVEDGGTIIVGGIYVEEESDIEKKVPLLSELPVLGNLFKNQGKDRRRRELLIFITPRIIGTLGTQSLKY